MSEFPDVDPGEFGVEGVPDGFVEYVAAQPELRSDQIAVKGLFRVDGRLVVRDAVETEDAYVGREVGITRRMIEQRLLRDDDDTRLERSRKYNVWRFRGWLTGEVESL